MANVPYIPLAAQQNFGRAVAVTKSDDTTYDPPLQGLYIGGAGNVAVVPAGQTEAVTFTAVPVGATLPVACTKVMSTNTTATLIVGLR